MLERISQDIAVLSSKLIRQSVLITDTNGIVLGCSDPPRIGSLHEASLEVIKSRYSAYHDISVAKQLEGTRAGVTLPIELGGEVIGTVGITGNPAEVSQYGLLIKTFVEMLLKDHLEQHLSALRERECLSLVREIINLHTESSDIQLVLSHGNSLGYELNTTRAAICLQFFENIDSELQSLSSQINRNGVSTIKEFFSSPQDICVSISTNMVLVFASVNPTVNHENVAATMRERCEQLKEQLENIQITSFIGIGGLTRSVLAMRQSYEEAHHAMRLCKGFQMQEGMFVFRESMFARILSSISKKSYQRYFEEYIDILIQQKDAEEIFRVITVWCESNFNSSEASQKLYIHKNTLSYRIDRIKKLCGLDLHKLFDAVILYLAVSLYQLDRDNEAYFLPL